MNVCEDCALRLFNNKHYNLQGVGNPYYGNLIIIPNVDYNAYKKGDITFSGQVEVIKEILHPFTGELDNLYIVPLFRCCDKIACEINDDIYNRCLVYLKKDIKKYNFKHILVLGEAVKWFLNCTIKDNLETIILSKNYRFYNVNYSPLTKYVNEEYFETFKTYLIKWYNYVISGMSCYDNYVILE